MQPTVWVCVLLCPTGIVAGACVRAHVCVGSPACLLFACSWYCSGGGRGLVHRGNKAEPGRKTAFLFPPLAPPRHHPPPPPPAVILSLGVFDPSIVRWCTSCCGGLSNLQKDLCLIEMKKKYNHLKGTKFALHFSVLHPPNIFNKWLDFCLRFGLWVPCVLHALADAHMPVAYLPPLICSIYNRWLCGSASVNLCTPSERGRETELHCGGGLIVTKECGSKPALKCQNISKSPGFFFSLCKILKNPW